MDEQIDALRARQRDEQRRRLVALADQRRAEAAAACVAWYAQATREQQPQPQQEA